MTRWAAQPLDLIRELRKLKPTVVHFSGHGGGGGRRQGAGPRRDIVAELGGDDTDDSDHQGGLFFQGPGGRPQLVTGAALRETFGAVAPSVKLVVLNACYSDIHAEALLVHIDCVVGVASSLRDDAARAFAIGFYGGLGERQSVAAVYLQGCAAISLEEPLDSKRPQLRVRDGVDAGQVVLAEINAADGVDGGTPRAPAAARSPSTETGALHCSSSHNVAVPISISSVHTSTPVRPIPAYADAEVEQLSTRLEDTRARRNKLRDAGIAANHLDREILELRRQLREGGRLRAGDSLSDDRYLLVKIVGRGGFAVVWEAYDCLAQQRVAIKVLHSNLAGDPLRRDRFFRGARVMMSLVHPALVRVLRSKEEDGGFYYFVMEFVPGGDLRDAVLNGYLTRDQSLPLILQVGDALATAHSRGMIHRDVKPSNILLDQNGQAKLTDFDLVGAQDTTGGTRTGALGTFVYAAPECLERPQDVTARADVYGLGMTMVFCLSGRELSPSTFRDTEPTIAKLDCPLEIRKIIQKAVAWEPQERFPDAATMVVEMRKALSFSTARDRGSRASMTAPTEQEAKTRGSTAGNNSKVAAVDRRNRPARRRRWIRAGITFASVVAVLVLLKIVQDRWLDQLIRNNLGTVVFTIAPFDRRGGAVVPAAGDPMPDLTVAVYGTKADDTNEPGDPIPDKLVRIVATGGAGSPRIQRISVLGGAVFLKLDGRGRPGEHCPPSWIRIQAFPGYRIDEIKRVELPVPTCQATLADTVTIEAGQFWYGGPGDPPSKHYGDPYYTEPERLIDLPAFAMDRTEVSNADFEPFARLEKLTGYARPIYSTTTVHEHDAEPAYPVIDIDAFEATAYCRFLGKRLPSDAEWTKAARGGLMVNGRPNPFPRRLYPWGNTAKPECVNHDYAATKAAWTGPVDALPCGASPYGVLQLVGNVQEWISREGQTDRDNPLHVLRGGSTEYPLEDDMISTIFRNHRDPRVRNYSNGVRCVVELESAP